MSLPKKMTLRLLGVGNHGKVFLCSDRMIAIKQIDRDEQDRHGNSNGLSTTALREIQALKRLDHANVIRLFGVRWGTKHVFLELELLPLSLRQIISSSGIVVQVAHRYMQHLLSGLAHCHERHILHRDIKPENLALGVDGKLKLSDFGLARHEMVGVEGGRAMRYTPQMVTLWYRSREVLVGSSYCIDADIWSAGCVFAEMLTGEVLFKGESEIGMVRHIDERTLRTELDTSFVVPPLGDPDALDLLCKCINPVCNRPNATALLSHRLVAL